MFASPPKIDLIEIQKREIRMILKASFLKNTFLGGVVLTAISGCMLDPDQWTVHRQGSGPSATVSYRYDAQSVASAKAAKDPLRPETIRLGPGEDVVYWKVDPMSLLREYHLRDGSIPTAEMIRHNGYSANTPLAKPMYTYFNTKDAFQRRDAEQQINTLLSSAFTNGEPVNRVVFWVPSQFTQYDFQRDEYTFCVFRPQPNPGCTLPLPNNSFYQDFRSKNYRLRIKNFPPSFTVRPGDEQIAREMEKEITRQGTRVTNVLYVVDLKPSVTERNVVDGELESIIIYKNRYMGNYHGTPDMNTHIMRIKVSLDESKEVKSSQNSGDLKFANLMSLKDQRLRQAIQKELGLKASKKNGFYTSEDCLAGEFVRAQVAQVDLNSDGKKEVIVTQDQPLGGMCFGNYGSSLVIYEVANNAKLKPLLYTGSINEVKLGEAARSSYRDIVFDDATCQAIWRWTGKEYDHYRSISKTAGGCR